MSERENKKRVRCGCLCVRAPIPTSMPAAATDLEEEDTATDLFSHNACLFST
jgi:hypothetical protein